MAGSKIFYVAGVVDCCSLIVTVVIMSAPGMARPLLPSFEAREYDDGSSCTPSSLSLQPRFAHIFEENNIARIFGNGHSSLIIIFYPFP